LDEVLSDRPVSVAATEAIGCSILRPQSRAVKASEFTYYKDVLPILQNNCQECHRSEGAAPFALMNFRQAANWAPDIKAFTQSRQMPPWKIKAGLPFHNERHLSEMEIFILADWADGGTPEGNPKDAPPPLKFTDAWRLGTPDLVLTMPDEFQVGPSGNDVFRCFVLPTNLLEDRFVHAIEVKPGNSRILHHALLFVDSAGKGQAMEQLQSKVLFRDPYGGNALDKGPGYYGGMGIGFSPTGNLGGWAPGQQPRLLPDGTAIRLPKGSDVVIQMHYHRNGRLEKDKTTIGLYYSKEKVNRSYQGEVLTGLFENIPAGNERFVVKGTFIATEKMTLYDLLPHMHMVGKEIKVTITPPDGPPTLLFQIKDWDFNWQETYVFKEPVEVKAGTRLDLEAIYDNSAKNANNPFNPPRTVSYGDQTFNEMCSVYLGGTSDGKDGWLPIIRAVKKKQ
jgi:Copper type II ascorbate-dependent monooxygenase, C-terminal domain